MSIESEAFKQYICLACGLIYDEEFGDPDSGLAPGTRFEDIPDDWECPLCGVTKTDFELFEKPVINMVEQSGTYSTQTGVVIVGAGIAGWSAVEAIRQLDQSISITLITACSGDVYHKPELSVAISRKLDLEKLIQERGVDAAKRLGVQLINDTFVVGISADAHQIRTTRGSFSFTKLVLAQGAKPAMPKALPPSLCWRVNDLMNWSGMQQALVKGPQHIAIVGAGMIGSEIAEDFVRAGHKVTLIDKNDVPLSGLLPRQASKRLLESFENMGIEYIGANDISAITALENDRKLLCFADGHTLDVDQILAATGLMTDNRLARLANLEFDRGIKVLPDTLQTSQLDIYALGDCINIEGMPCRFIEPIKHQAKAIAHAILNKPCDAYEHNAPVVRLKTRALPVLINGQPNAKQRWHVVLDNKHELIMQQKSGEHITATLHVGSTNKQNAA